MTDAVNVTDVTEAACAAHVLMRLVQLTCLMQLMQLMRLMQLMQPKKKQRQKDSKKHLVFQLQHQAKWQQQFLSQQRKGQVLQHTMQLLPLVARSRPEVEPQGHQGQRQRACPACGPSMRP